MDHAHGEARQALERKPGRGIQNKSADPKNVVQGQSRRKRSEPVYTVTPTNGVALAALIWGGAHG